jgi:hypothetical protein
MSIAACECMQPTLWDCERKGIFLGVDMTNSRYGDVWFYQCPICAQNWLFYRVEYPSFTRSGRWFRTIIPTENSEHIKPEHAEALMNASYYRVVGGSFYQSPGIIITAKTELPFD